MSQPRRRRRRGRRRSSGSSGSSETNNRESTDGSRQAGDGGQSQGRASKNRKSRGRRGRTRARGGGRPSSPKSSEDLVRGDPKRPPARLTRDHDGTTLEQVIGDLQSEHGVPQHPQEYRITLKVAEERGERHAPAEETPDAPPANNGSENTNGDRPKREKAPAAPRIGANASDAEEGATTPKSSRRKRSRRRRRKPKSSGGG